MSPRLVERGVYLEAYLRPLGAWLDRPDVTDILIDAPGEVWVETLGRGLRRQPASSRSRSTCGRVSSPSLMIRNVTRGAPHQPWTGRQECHL